MTGVRLGVTLPQFTGDPSKLLDGARRAEDAGLDSVWLFDHLWPLTGGKSRSMFECWTSLAYIAAVTKRVTVGTLVSRSSMRHPVLLAKMAATVHAIAPGRLVVGIGSGDEASRPENDSVGLPYYPGRERTDQLASTVSVVNSFLRHEVVDQSDEFTELKGLPATPRTSTPPPLWVGGRSRAALKVAATLADGWNGWGGTPQRFAHDARRLRLLAGGRPIVLSWASLVILASSPAEAERKLRGRSPTDYVTGDVDTVCARVEEFVRAGAGHIIATFPDSSEPGNFEALAAMGSRLPSPPGDRT